MFAWDDPKAPKKKPHKKQLPRGDNARRDAMYRRELEDRAALLYRLGYPEKLAKARLAANVAWDFELHGRPRHAADVERIVNEVYRRGGRAGGPPSV
jgi:hypothetical protein